MNMLASLKLYATIATAVGTLVYAPVSVAQSDGSVSRAERKAQTRAANKSGELLKAGEAGVPEKEFQSSKTRTDRKAETLEARKKGDLPPPGEATYRAQAPMPFKSDKTRAERKSETLQAAKQGDLLPAGEGEDPAMVKTTPKRRQTN